MKKSKIVMGLSLMVIFSLTFFPRSENNQPESRLTGATGNERLNILVELTKTFSKKDRTKAISYGKEALELMRSIPDSKNLPEHLNRLIRIAYRLGDYKVVSEYAIRSLEITDKTGDKYKYAETLEFVLKAGEIWDKLGEYNGTGKLYS